MSRALPWARPWASLAGLVLVLALVAHGLVFLDHERSRRLAEQTPDPEAAAARVAPRDYVIPPGHEDDVDALLEVLLESGTLPGVGQYSFAIEQRSVEVQLFPAKLPAATKVDPDACPGPRWVRPPGALFLTRAPPPADLLSEAGSGVHEHRGPNGSLWLRWHWCVSQSPVPEAALAKLSETFAAHPALERIWQPVGAEPPPPPPERARESGLLTPVAAALGLDHERLSAWVLALGSLASILVGFSLGPRWPGFRGSPSPAPERKRGIGIGIWIGVAVLLAFDLGLSLDLGLSRVLDTDESWAYPSAGSMFAENHDPWVHPPLFHLVQQPWIRAQAWAEGDNLLILRGPMIGFGLLATGATIVAIGLRAHRRQAPWLLVLALPCALAPQLTSTLVLARPYALAAALVVVCALALWPATLATVSSALSSPPKPWALRVQWTLALLAAGLAAWTDVIAGAAAATLVLARLGSDLESGPRRTWLFMFAPVLVLALWIVPLVPGALEAASHHVDPNQSEATLDALGIARPGDVLPDPKLTWRIPAFCVFGVDAKLVPVGLVAVVALVGMFGWSLRRGVRRIEAALPLALLGAWLVLASSLVHLRARNIAFAPPLTALLAASVLASRPKRAGTAPINQ